MVFWLAAFFHHHLLLCLSYLPVSLLRNFHPCSQFSEELKFTLVNSKVWKRRNLGIEDGHLLHLYFTTTKFKFKTVQAMWLPWFWGLKPIVCCVSLQVRDTLLLKASYSGQPLMPPVRKWAGLGASAQFILFPSSHPVGKETNYVYLCCLCCLSVEMMLPLYVLVSSLFSHDRTKNEIAREENAYNSYIFFVWWKTPPR